jgi:Effector protein
VTNSSLVANPTMADPASGHSAPTKEELTAQSNAATDHFDDRPPAACESCCGNEIPEASTLPENQPPEHQNDVPYHGLIIRGNDDFVKRVKEDLDVLATTSCGKELFAKLAQAAKKGRKVRIKETDEGSSTHHFNNPGTFKKGKMFRYRYQHAPNCQESFRGTGEGSDSEISYNPTVTVPDPLIQGAHERPRQISLAHELVHAMLAASGEFDTGYKDNVWNYERQAAGIGPYHKGVNENCFRKAWPRSQKYPQGVPERTRYGTEEEGKEPFY